jgi:hypothetical protein
MDTPLVAAILDLVQMAGLTAEYAPLWGALLGVGVLLAFDVLRGLLK